MAINKVICLDFDDVINDYDTWENEGYIKIKGEPIAGIKKAIAQFKKAGCTILVHSVRCGHIGGANAISDYLAKHNIPVDAVCHNKPPADIYVDDKAITFKGKWNKSMIQNVLKFKGWNTSTAPYTYPKEDKGK